MAPGFFLDRFFKKIFRYRFSWKYIYWDPSYSVHTDGYDESLFAIFASAPKKKNPMKVMCRGWGSNRVNTGYTSESLPPQLARLMWSHSSNQRTCNVTHVCDPTKVKVKVKACRPDNPYPTAFPYGNGMVLHFYQQQESSTTKTVHKVINKGLKAYV